MYWRISFVIPLLGLALSSSVVAQANLATVVGAPGSASWHASCPGSRHVPFGASQIVSCAANPTTCNVSRTTIDTSTFPDAVCADGTPGVFYVRPGVGADIHKWVLHVQGGGGCQTYEDCLARWCGAQGNVPYSANKMSSDWNADGTLDLPLQGRASGMTDDNARNAFGTWTHVWFYYCSSDSWMGRASDVAYSDPAGTNDFSLHHRGHTILNAARQMLRKRNAHPLWTADDGTDVPNLDDATDVIVTGTSAGASGAIQNVDWFLRPLSAPNKFFVMDAMLDMTDDVLLSNDVWVDVDGDGVGDALYYSQRITASLDSWSSGWKHAIDAFVDESCRAVYEPLGRLDRCSYNGVILRLQDGGVPFIETPTFIRLDLEDGVVSSRWTDMGPSGERLMIGQFGRPTTRDDFTVLARESLVELHNAVGTPVTGVFGPRCGMHVGLESERPFTAHVTPHTVQLVGGAWVATIAPSSAHDALWAWYATGAPVHYLDTSDVHDPTVRNHPITDPVTQFSGGPGCVY